MPNIKLTFYITGIAYGQFEKAVFETILDGNDLNNNYRFHDGEYNFQEWIADNITEIINVADLYPVFDHVVLHHEETDKSYGALGKAFVLTPLGKKIGKLLFDNDPTPLEKHLKGVPKKRTTNPKKTSKLPKKEEVKPPKKDYPSCWISPSGKEHVVGWVGHNQFASEWLLENGWDFDEIHGGRKYPYELLQDEGWVRILGWTDPPTYYIPDRVTPKQRKAILDYCQANSCPLPERFRS